MKKARTPRYVTRAQLQKLRTDIFRAAPTVLRRRTDSTNTRVKALAAKGGEEGLLFVARSQSKGRGRMGRRFFSPKGNGLYFSLLLRPELSAGNAGLITTAAAVAVCRALEKCGAERPQIKWVNDVCVQGKKVCGILTESKAVSGKMEYAVLGVGINLLSPKKGFDASIAQIAGSAFTSPVSPSAVLAAFLHEFSEIYQSVQDAPHYAEYKSRMLYLGKSINVITPTDTYGATLVDIAPDFSLTVRLANGQEQQISQGEVSLRPSENKE